MYLQNRASVHRKPKTTPHSAQHLSGRWYSDATAGAKGRVLVLGGCTAVGKSKLAVHLAKQLNGAIIGIDSVKVYNGFIVGSNRIESIQSVPHYLIGHRDSREAYSVGDYYRDAKDTITKVLEEGKVPIVVGGTGLYLTWLFYGPATAPRKNVELYQHLLQQIQADGWEKSIARLRLVDSEYADSLDRNQYTRIARALEVYQGSGRPLSTYKQNLGLTRAEQLFDFRAFCLTITPREQLFRSIDLRCETMLQNGLFQEVGRLHHEGLLPSSSPASLAVGYRQSLDFLRTHDFSAKGFAKYLAEFQGASRSLAQEQIKWFRKEPTFNWLDIHSRDVAPAIERLYRMSTPEFLAAVQQDPDFVSQESETKSRMDTTKEMRTYRSVLKYFSDPEQVQIQLESANEVFNKYFT